MLLLVVDDDISIAVLVDHAVAFTADFVIGTTPFVVGVVVVINVTVFQLILLKTILQLLQFLLVAAMYFYYYCCCSC